MDIPNDHCQASQRSKKPINPLKDKMNNLFLGLKKDDTKTQVEEEKKEPSDILSIEQNKEETNEDSINQPIMPIISKIVINSSVDDDKDATISKEEETMDKKKGESDDNSSDDGGFSASEDDHSHHHDEDYSFNSQLGVDIDDMPISEEYKIKVNILEERKNRERAEEK